MATYTVKFSGSGDLNNLTATTITNIGKFLSGTFAVDSATQATVTVPGPLTAKSMNNALASNKVLNLTTVSITAT